MALCFRIVFIPRCILWRWHQKLRIATQFVRVKTLCTPHAMLFVCLFFSTMFEVKVPPLCREQRVLHALKIVQRFEVTIFIALFLKSEDLRRYKFSSRRIKSINTLFRILSILILVCLKIGRDYNTNVLLSTRLTERESCFYRKTRAPLNAIARKRP